MKNAAKCDTWCELQNPANHRIFERKLRPRPSGRGHACLGVTPPAGRPCARARARGGPKRSAPRGARRGEWWDSLFIVAAAAVRRRGGREEEKGTEPRRERGAGPPRGARPLGPRPQVRRGHPPSLSI
ncbi:unnamed protein product [Spirodela intermedia]|uniref:Uncharacterized protein n=1 Tax=Spirodela intermedia TaxID=51605 RepID=A0A7I8IBS8_SPIIN|nr:unnamed protein product [Spirodela intermedia]CAA6655159.1 unnamed protein product [Spirodela intermedia]